jgi:hypothetical protein
MFGNYSERDVDGGFYYRNPDGRSGVFTIGDYRAVGNVDGTCAYGTGALLEILQIPHLLLVEEATLLMAS